MRIAWVVCTYNRPHLLPRIIACFEQQTYEDRCMLILDDGGQYQSQTGEKWLLYSTSKRYPSLGTKRNASIDLARIHCGPIDAIMPVDDDDLVLPWHTEAAAKTLETADWSRPSQVLAPRVFGDQWLFASYYTGSQTDQRLDRRFHPAWAVRISAIEQAGWYPENMSGPEDFDLMRRMETAGISQADPVELGYRPSYVYCWAHGQNISGMLNASDRSGQKAWASLEKQLEPAVLQPWTPPFDPYNPVIAPGAPRPRPF